jgi:16S rRNA (guanine527-N7)-methyltransferase
VKQSVLSPSEFQDLTGVSGDKLGKLEVYVDLLRHWARRINLVSQASLIDPWRRHVLDSAQLFPLLPDDGKAVLDLGSGAGLPGLILAILGAPRVQLVESTGRKCAFLAQAMRETGTTARLHDCRVKELAPFPAGVVTARACAPLPRLLALAWPFVEGGGMCLFLKGRKADKELTESTKKWTMDVTRTTSLSDPSGVILKVENLSVRHG